jgi:hypothetical protein
VRGQPVLSEQCEDVIDDRILRLRQQIGFREGCLRNFGMGILATKLGDDVLEVLLRAEPLSFEDFHDGRDLPHVGDGRFFDGHRVTLETIVTHEMSQRNPVRVV